MVPPDASALSVVSVAASTTCSVNIASLSSLTALFSSVPMVVSTLPVPPSLLVAPLALPSSESAAESHSKLKTLRSLITSEAS